MTQTLNYSGTLVIETCWCGCRHAIPKELHDHQAAQHRDGRTQTGIHCPLGHTYILSGEGEAEKLRRQLATAQQRTQAERDLREDTERRLSAQKGATTRAKKRHAAALCPCCNRSFVQLRRHMETKHPDFEPERSA